ncbi:unnamed protein product, partial [Brachionus calyciflorus]
QNKSLSFESVFTGLISVSGILCGKTVVNACGSFTQPLTFYSLLVGPVSSKKSVCVELFKNSYDSAVTTLSNYGDPDFENSKFKLQAKANSSVTIESLLKELSNRSNLIQCWDGFSTLVSSFGMYKCGNGSFDRSIFLTLYNGQKSFSHTVKSYEFEIKDPRLCIFASGHHWKAIDMIEDENSFKGDGFISRFLICCPKPVRLKLRQL